MESVDEINLDENIDQPKTNPEPKKQPEIKMDSSAKVKKQPNTWAITSIILFIAVIVLGIYAFGYDKSTIVQVDVMPEAELKTFMETQLNNLLNGQATTKIDTVTKSKGMYLVNMTLESSQGDEKMTAYVTLDGDYMFVQPLVLSEIPDPSAELEAQLSAIPKTEKAEAELFIMTYCPYGLQSQKAMLPVMSLLDDVADIEIKFVDYAMHDAKEVYENLRQYCIQLEQDDKYLDYATCFVQTDNYTNCIEEASIDKEKLDACMVRVDDDYNITALLEDESSWSSIYPPFNVNAEENVLYGVQGSPTLIINGETISVDRSPEAIKDAICAGFNDQPVECQTELSANAAAPGIGSLDAEYDANIQATCS